MPSASAEHKDLPLVPESVLKRRHDLDDLKRKRQAILDGVVGGQKRNKNDDGKRGKYVRKPETYLAKAKHRKNERIRYKRVKKKGMQKRASKDPIIKTKLIQIDNENRRR